MKQLISQSQTRIFIVLIACALLMFASSFLISGFFGTAHVGARDVITILGNRLFGADLGDTSKSAATIVWDLRIPRALLALAIGGGLAVSGTAMQAVTQNVLADPYVMGVSSGALVGVTAVYFVNPALASNSSILFVVAFCGALSALFLVYRLGKYSGTIIASRLILAGMAMSIVFNSISNFFILASQDVNAPRAVITWTLGSLAGARWDNILLPIVGILLCSCYFFWKARDFDLMCLGDHTALSLGLPIVRAKKNAIVVVSITAALCVASTGLIGLVGFIIPHILRMLVGSGHRRLFVATFIVGGIFLMWMDIFSRTLLAPQELPVGIFSALIGGPFFVWVLLRKRA